MTVKENLCNVILENNVPKKINICIVKGHQSFIGIKEFNGPIVSLKLHSNVPTLLNPFDYFSKKLIDREVIWQTWGDNEETYFVKDDSPEK